MQSTTRNIILAAAGLAPAVSGLLSMEVRYTDNMIDGRYLLDTISALRNCRCVFTELYAAGTS